MVGLGRGIAWGLEWGVILVLGWIMGVGMGILVMGIGEWAFTMWGGVWLPDKVDPPSPCRWNLKGLRFMVSALATS